MKIIIIILTIVIVALLLAFYCLSVSYEDYLEMEEENERLSHLLEECFWMQNDSLEAYREMLSAACHEGGFWESEEGIVDVDDEEDQGFLSI